MEEIASGLQERLAVVLVEDIVISILALDDIRLVDLLVENVKG